MKQLPSLSLAGMELRRFLRGRLPVAALVVLAVIPLLYGALYLYAFWDPYGRLNHFPADLVTAPDPDADPRAGQLRVVSDDATNYLSGVFARTARRHAGRQPGPALHRRRPDRRAGRAAARRGAGRQPGTGAGRPAGHVREAVAVGDP